MCLLKGSWRVSHTREMQRNRQYKRWRSENKGSPNEVVDQCTHPGPFHYLSGIADVFEVSVALSVRLSVKIRRQQAPTSAGWPALRCRTALRKCSSASSGSIRRPSEDAQGRRQVAEHLVEAAIRAKSFRTMDSVGADCAGGAVDGQGGRPVLPLDGDRAEVEEHERVVGPLGGLGLEDLLPAGACAPTAPGRRSPCAGP